MSEETEKLDVLQDKVVARLREVFDPEIPVNIYDLGLIYKISAEVATAAPGKYDIAVDMTLTTPNCPVAGQMPAMVQQAVLREGDVNDVKVNLVWDPPWDRSRMSDDAKLQLNFF
jgi:FeS assembly SUF system protein